MSDDTTESKPIPVTAIQSDVAEMIVECAKNGTVKVDDTNSVTAGDLLTGIWSNNYFAFDTSTKVSLLILNRMNKPLTLKSNAFESADSHEGFQYRHPACLISGDARTGTYKDRDVIPGLDAGSAYVGLYFFEGYSHANIFRHHYLSGSLEFSSEDATDTIGIGFYAYPGQTCVTATANFSRWGDHDNFAGMFATGATDSTCYSKHGAVTVYASLKTWSQVAQYEDEDEISSFVVTMVVVPST